MNTFVFGIYLVFLFTILKIVSRWIFYADRKIIIKNYISDSIYIYISYIIVNYIMNNYFNLSLKSDVHTSPNVYTDSPSF